jgi:hypothetical protein
LRLPDAQLHGRVSHERLKVLHMVRALGGGWNVTEA